MIIGTGRVIPPSTDVIECTYPTQGSLKMDIFDLNAVQADVQQEFTRPIRSVYIDLAYLQDFYLGGLLCKHCNEKDYTHIYEGMNAYNARITYERTKFFPELNETDESLMEYITDQNHSDNLIQCSPVTDFFLKLPEFHRSAQERNSIVAENNTDSTITYVINPYPLKLSPTSVQLLKFRMSSILTNFRLGIIETRSRDMSEVSMNTFDTFFIENLNELTDDTGNLYKYFFLENKFSDRLVAAPRRINDPRLVRDIDILTPEKIDEALTNTDAICNLFATFSYVDIQILCEESKVG